MRRTMSNAKQSGRGHGVGVRRGGAHRGRPRRRSREAKADHGGRHRRKSWPPRVPDFADLQTTLKDIQDAAKAASSDCPRCADMRADLSRRVAKVNSLQAVLAQIMETRRHARDAAAVAVRHAREVRGVLVGSVQRLLAGNQAIAKLDDVMRPSVSCVLCMEPMTKAVAFPFCGHSHCLKCIFNAAKAESSQVAGGVVASCSSTATIRCPTCVRQARHDWVRDNGSGAEQFEISKARQRRVVVLLDKEQHGADMKPPSASHANDAQMHRGVQMAFASALDDNLDPALPWVAAVRRRPLSSLRPNPVVDEVVGRLHTWNATMSHVTKTVAYLEHLLTATTQLQSADELAAAAKGAGLIGAPLPLAPDAVDKAARALLGDE